MLSSEEAPVRFVANGVSYALSAGWARKDGTALATVAGNLVNARVVAVVEKDGVVVDAIVQFLREAGGSVLTARVEGSALQNLVMEGVPAPSSKKAFKRPGK